MIAGGGEISKLNGKDLYLRWWFVGWVQRYTLGRGREGWGGGKCSPRGYAAMRGVVWQKNRDRQLETCDAVSGCLLLGGRDGMKGSLKMGKSCFQAAFGVI